MPPDFHFIRPYWLLALIPLALLLWRLNRGNGAGRAWTGLVDPHLLRHLLSHESARVRRAPLLLLALGWLLAVLALAGPAWERLPTPVYQAQSYRVLVLDLSPSMNAQDLRPTRLAQARFEILNLLRRDTEGQTALLAYGSEPFVVSPLTTDTDTIAAQVPSLETTLLPVQGGRRTDLALRHAADLLRQAGAPEGEVILVSDGVDNPAAAGEAVRELNESGYRLSVLGMGTAKGAPVPLADGGFLKDADGAILLPRLDAAALAELAARGGGRYVQASADDQDIDALLPPTPDEADQRSRKEQVRGDQWREQGPWLLLVLLPLAAMAFRRGWLSPLLLLVFVLPPPPAQAFEWRDLWQRPDQRAARAYAAGEHQQAAETFRRPDWRAASRYQAGDYAGAVQELEGMQGAEHQYNRGNALARMGDLKQAIEAYDSVLAEVPAHTDARYNRDLLQRLLDKQQQQQQGQEQQGPEQNQDQGQEQQTSESGGQQGDNQSQSEGSQGADGAAADDQQPGQEQGEEQGGSARDESAGQDSAQQQKPEEQAGQNDPAQGGPRSESPQGQGDEAESSPEPGREDLLQDKQAATPGTTQPGQPEPSDIDPEDRQAMEMMLRRVEDDPAGLLRQRFLLQHLRREGKL